MNCNFLVGIGLAISLAIFSHGQLVPSINVVNSVRLVSSNSTTQRLANARIHGEFVYLYQENPSYVYTLNVTQLRVHSPSLPINFTTDDIGSLFTIGTAALDGGHESLYLASGDTVYKYVKGASGPVPSLVLEEFILPTTSFLHNNANTTYMYIPWTALANGETERYEYPFCYIPLIKGELSPGHLPARQNL